MSFAAVLAFVGGIVTAVPTFAQSGNGLDPLEWSWQLLEINDGGQATLVPPGIGITALFYADTLSVQGACSTARGEYSRNEATIQIFPPQIETRGCDPATQAVDDAFYDGLSRARTWEASGGCAGTDPSCRPSILKLLDEVGAPVMTLTGATLPADPGLSRWDLGRIGDADGAIGPIIAGVQPWIEFQRGGHVVGDSGCGSFIGDYTVNGDTVSISDIVTEAPDCPEALGEQADTIIRALGDVTDFEVLPAGLVLRDAAGQTRLAFVPALDLAGRTWTPFEIMLPGGEALERGNEYLSTSAVRFAALQADGTTVCSRTFEGPMLSSGLALTVEVATPPDTKCPKTKKDRLPYQAVEDAFLGALDRTASHALRGDELLLMDVDGSVITRLAPQADIAGQTWVVTELDKKPNSGKARLGDPVGEAPTAEFTEPAIGGLTGSTGVRPYDADYAQRGGGQIRIVNAEATGTGCGRRVAKSDARCVQEQLFLDLLESATSIVVRPGDMRLLKGQRIILRFEPQDVLAARQAAEAEAAAETDPAEDDS
jgi:heat shock protein HslJ